MGGDGALSADRQQAGAATPAAPVSPQDRIEAIDAVRGVALFGVLIVNLVTEFRVSIFQQFLGPPPGGGADLIAERLVALGFQSKAFCLFALLFGIGLAIQFERLSVAGRPLYWLSRRLAVLLGFGLVHLVFIWNGDILTEYALAGFVVLPLLLLRARTLLLAALAFLAAYAGAPALYSIDWPGAAELRAHVKDERFQIVSSVRGLPLGVRDELQTLFGGQALDIAEPGTPFQVTDVMVNAKLPIRRLVAAGCSTDHCLVYYERGGIAHTWQVLLFHWTPAATRFEWGGMAPNGLASIEQVRNAVLSGAVKGATKFW